MIRVGAVGIPLKVHVVDKDGADVPIDGTSAKYILLTSAKGVTVQKTAEFVTDGTDGWMKYVTEAGDIGADRTDNDAAGTWKIQGYVTWATPVSLDTEVEDFKVGKNLVP